MATNSKSKVGRRAPLSRQRIVKAALRYIDAHGLDRLSMHKLGAQLDVQGMTLYHYVANKDDVLDGVVELLWTEVEGEVAGSDWRGECRSFARAIRSVVYRHPNAALLLVSRGIMPSSALRCIQALITTATNEGIPEADAYALLRTITSYALGTSLHEIAWSTGRPGCAQGSARTFVLPGTPAELTAIADVFCGQSDNDTQFELGLDLMLR